MPATPLFVFGVASDVSFSLCKIFYAQYTVEILYAPHIKYEIQFFIRYTSTLQHYEDLKTCRYFYSVLKTLFHCV